MDEHLLLLPTRNSHAQFAAASNPARWRRLEKKPFRQPPGKNDRDKVDNLRKRAPRQAELLEAIAKLEKPMPAAQLLRKTSFDNQTLRTLANRGLIEPRE